MDDWQSRIWDTVVGAVKDFFTDSGPQWAAAIAYYSLLSLFPLLLAAASIAAYFVNPDRVIDLITQLLGDFLPRGEQRIEEIVNSAVEARGSTSAISILLFLWSGTRVFGVITKALNIAYDVDEKYGFFRRLLVELIMLLTIGLLFILAIASRTVLFTLINLLEVLPASGALSLLVVWVVPALLLLAAFFLSYKYIPRRDVDKRAALAGAATATVLFLLALPLFNYYLNNFSNYNLIYGSLALVIILVLWAWLVAVIFLFGGEVSSHVQEVIIEGKNAKDVEEQHRRRSPIRVEE